MDSVKRNAKAWMAAAAILAVVGIQAAMVELPLTATQSGWARIVLAVLMAGGTYGVWRVPNTPILDEPPPGKDRWSRPGSPGEHR